MHRPPARLEVVAGNAAGMSVMVEDELMIGRHAEGAGRLADDEEISRMHARIALDADGFCAIEDLGSTNGTIVNGLRISAPQPLSVGDTIELGQTTLLVREVPQVATAAVAPSGTLQPTVVPRPRAESAPDEPENEITRPKPEPAPGEAMADGQPPPPLSLRLDVDFAAGEARILLGEESPAVRAVFDGGAWRTAPPNEKGDAV
jgi:predicted component of type VI protein secretion system